MALVNISGHKKGPRGSLKRALAITVIDKYFLFGAASGLFGSLGLGLYLWLIRSGILEFDGDYRAIRGLHASMQFYLFLTPFILGFLLQSGPKLFEVHEPLPRFAYLTLPATVTGAAALIIAPSSFAGPLILSTACLTAAISLLPLYLAATPYVQWRFGGFAMCGLISLSAGAFIDPYLPANAILLFWFGIVSIILATGQQFMAGVLKAKLRSINYFRITAALYSATGLSLLLALLGFHNSWKLISGLMILTIISFLNASGGKAIFKNLHTPLGLAFAFAFAWAFIGASLLSRGYANMDNAMHAWGIGFAFTLIIAVSTRLISWITDKQILKDRTLIVSLVLWQIATFVRVTHGIFSFPRIVIIAAGVLTTLVLVTWAAAILSGAVPFVLKDLSALGKTGVFRFTKHGANND